MLDNPLITLIKSTIEAGEALAGIPGTPIKQAFQPTQQGVNKGPTAYLTKVLDNPIGFTARSNVFDPIKNEEIHTELQQYESTFQISTLSTQDPTDQTQYTASDILNLIAQILRSDASLAALQAQSIALINVGKARNVPFIDDRQRHEFSPTFDFILAHKQIVTSEVVVLQSNKFDIQAV